MTNTGIHLLDIYMLQYCDQTVIFQVCATTPTTVTLIELEQKKCKGGMTLTSTYKATKHPLIIKEDNVFTRSSYRVRAIRRDKKLPIRIGIDTEIFWEAKKNMMFPGVGVYLAIPFEDHRIAYWKGPEEGKKDSQNKTC